MGFVDMARAYAHLEPLRMDVTRLEEHREKRKEARQGLQTALTPTSQLAEPTDGDVTIRTEPAAVLKVSQHSVRGRS